MRQHLEEADSYYFLDPKDTAPCKPIHKKDGEIIELIISIVNKTGGETLAGILETWKKTPDDKVIEALEFYRDSEQLEEEIKDISGDIWSKLIEKMKRAYVTIQEHSLIASHIYSVKKRNIHDGRPLYTILINPEEDMPPQFEWFLNKEFRWSTKEARDIAFEELKTSMSNHLMCKFLN